MPCHGCILPSLYLVSVVFGTAISTPLYIFGKCFSYLYRMRQRMRGREKEGGKEGGIEVVEGE